MQKRYSFVGIKVFYPGSQSVSVLLFISFPGPGLIQNIQACESGSPQDCPQDSLGIVPGLGKHEVHRNLFIQDVFKCLLIRVPDFFVGLGYVSVCHSDSIRTVRIARIRKSGCARRSRLLFLWFLPFATSPELSLY